MPPSLADPNIGIHDHAAEMIRRAGHDVLRVLSVYSAGDATTNTDAVLFLSPGLQPMTAYLWCEEKKTGGMNHRKTTVHHVEVEKGWD